MLNLPEDVVRHPPDTDVEGENVLGHLIYAVTLQLVDDVLEEKKKVYAITVPGGPPTTGNTPKSLEFMFFKNSLGVPRGS